MTTAKAVAHQMSEDLDEVTATAVDLVAGETAMDLDVEVEIAMDLDVEVTAMGLDVEVETAMDQDVEVEAAMEAQVAPHTALPAAVAEILVEVEAGATSEEVGAVVVTLEAAVGASADVEEAATRNLTWVK